MSVTEIRNRLEHAEQPAQGPSRISEADLMASITPRSLRVEPCACGGTVAATDGDWADIRAAILRHARCESHQAWRKALGL